MSKDLKHSIYISTECLSEKMLFDYIDNKLNQKERHIVEKHLLDCEMCSDAIEGLELVKDRNRIALIKEAIAKKLSESSEKEAVVVSFNYKLVLSVAATIALLVVGVFYFNSTSLKEVTQGDMAELKQNESPGTTDAPPPPPAPMDETETSVSQTMAGTGSTTIVTKGESFKLSPQKTADQEIALAEEGQAKESGYYKYSDGDVENNNQQRPDEIAANGAIVVTDELTTLDDRKDNNLETVSIPKAVVTEREKDAKIDNTKKSEEEAAGASGGTYAWTTNPTPEQNKNTTKTAGDQSGEQNELAKKAETGGKYRAQSSDKGKDKLAAIQKEKENRKNEDATVSGTIAYEPQSAKQDNDGLKSETKTTTANNTTSNTVSANDNAPAFESTIVADSTEQVYTVVEQMPQYPGGDAALIKGATKQLTYPAKDDASNSYGTIIIEFIVDSSGKATHPKLIKPKSAALEKQVNEFVNKMPKWKPGKQNNKNVSVKLVLPIKINVK